MRERWVSYKLSSLWATFATYHYIVNSPSPWPWAKRNQPVGLVTPIEWLLILIHFSNLQLEQKRSTSFHANALKRGLQFWYLVCMWQAHRSSGRVSTFLVLFYMTFEVWISLMIIVVEMDKSCGNVIIVYGPWSWNKRKLDKEKWKKRWIINQRNVKNEDLTTKTVCLFYDKGSMYFTDHSYVCVSILQTTIHCFKGESWSVLPSLINWIKPRTNI